MSASTVDREKLQERLDYWCGKLRLTPGWDVRLEWVDDPHWPKTGDFKIDCDDRKAILMLNAANRNHAPLLRFYLREGMTPHSFRMFKRL